jgi:hypothetical protein
MAVGTVTQNIKKENSETKVSIIEINWVASSSDGSVPSFETYQINGYLIHAVTIPGTPSPTALYDIALTDENGLAVMGGTMSDRSATAKEVAIPKLNSLDSIYGAIYVAGPLTLAITNNSVNSAAGKILLYVQR